MKNILLIFFLTVADCVIAQPLISNFSPVSGNIGTVVTITGSGFSSNPSNNIVFFGATRAVVNTAFASSLNVTVPAGATYQPISVTVSGLSGFSAKPFLVTIPSVGAFSTNSFLPGGATFYETSLYPQSLSAADLDGDGKPDLLTPGNYNSPFATFSVLRNTSTAGNINFAGKQQIQTGDNSAFATTADLDGDGMPDVITASTTNQGVCVFRNTSIIGSISFAGIQNFSTGSNPNSISIADFDNDGRPDVAVVNYTSNTVSVLKNTSSVGNISFAAKQDLLTALAPRSVVSTDLDGDGKQDLAVTNEFSNSVSVYRNLSSASGISFSSKTDYVTSNAPYGITAGDLDGDGRNELVAVGSSASKASVFRNTSTIGSISFAAKVDLSTANAPKSVYIDNANGDGKPDIIVAAANSSIIPNTSTPGTLSFAANVYLWFESFAISGADMDLDGKTDILGAHISLSRVYVARNKCNEPIISFLSPSSAAAGQTVGITGQNFTGTTAVSFGGQPASSFSVVSGTQINAVVGTGFSGTVNVQNSFGTGSTGNFAFAGPPVITDFSPSTTGPGTLVGIRGKNFTNVTAVRFGSINASSYTVVSADSISAMVGNSGSTGNVEVISSYGTGSKAGFTFLPPPVISSFVPGSAATASTVTINGNNFNGTTNVKFGGVDAASFTIVSSTQLTAVVGPGASGNVSVTSAGGTITSPGFVHLPSVTSFTPTAAASGTSVSINGYGFLNVSSVQFGSAWAASFTVNSPNHITAIVGSGGTGNITVTTSAGAGILAGFSFIPPPVITSFYPKMTGLGGAVTITGQNFSNTTAVSFGGTPASSFVVNSPTSLTAIVANGTTGGITVTTSPGGITTLGGPLTADRFEFVAHTLINSFNPESGNVGSLVTINGANFSTAPNNNFVYFGPVRAEVVTASANVLTVKVPPGAAYDRISVTANGFTGYTTKPFLVRFQGSVITANSFGKKHYAAGSKPAGIAAADFNGDGKPDLVVSNSNSNIIMIYLNSSAEGVTSFLPPISIIAGNRTHGVVAADVDNDGKPDIVSLSYFAGGSTGDSLYVHRNISTPGSTSFSAPVRTATSFNSVAVVIADLSLDGKPDFCIVNSGGGGPYGGYQFMSFIKNNSTPGNIVLGSLEYYQAATISSGSYYPNSIATGDFNADGIPDIVMGYANSGFLSVLRNYTKPGNFTLSLDKWYTSSPHFGSGYDDIAISDFNNDGISDIVSTGFIFGGVNPPSLQQSTYSPSIGGVMIAGDFDGDGKTDIGKTTGIYTTPQNTLRIRKNTTSSGTITFGNEIFFGSGTNPQSIASADFDLDGKPDIAVANMDSDNITVFENRIGEPVNLCPGGSLYLISDKTGASYQWQVNTGSGFTNLSSGTNYSGVSDDSLLLSNITGGFDRFQYRCLVNGSIFSEIFTIQFLNTWTGTMNSAWEDAGNWSCGSIPDNNTDVILTSGTITINTNVTVRTLTVGAGVQLIVSPGVQLIVLR